MSANPFMDPEVLVRLANARMPFGKYSGRLLIDLPESYLIWFARKGYPRASWASSWRRYTRSRERPRGTAQASGPEGLKRSKAIYSGYSLVNRQRIGEIARQKQQRVNADGFLIVSRVLRWLCHGETIEKAIAKANEKFPSESLRADENSLADLRAHYEYLAAHEDIIQKLDRVKQKRV